MTPVILDTDIISFVFKGHPAAALYADDLNGRELIISFMTLAELERWPIEAKWGTAKRDHLKTMLDSFSIVPWDRILCTTWAKVMSGAKAKGFRIECADAWIAATALSYDIPLVTHNRNDYRGVEGLTVICHA